MTAAIHSGRAEQGDESIKHLLRVRQVNHTMLCRRYRFHRWRNWGSEQERNFSKLPQLAKGLSEAGLESMLFTNSSIPLLPGRKELGNGKDRQDSVSLGLCLNPAILVVSLRFCCPGIECKALSSKQGELPALWPLPELSCRPRNSFLGRSDLSSLRATQ